MSKVFYQVSTNSPKLIDNPASLTYNASDV